MANGHKGDDVVKKVGKRLIDDSGRKKARRERMQKVLGGIKENEEYANRRLSTVSDRRSTLLGFQEDF